MIDSELTLNFGLTPVDKWIIAGAVGATEHLVYMAAITIPKLGISPFGKFTGGNLKFGLILQNVLLGRDFLSNIIMIYYGVKAQFTIITAAQYTAVTKLEHV